MRPNISVPAMRQTSVTVLSDSRAGPNWILCSHGSLMIPVKSRNPNVSNAMTATATAVLILRSIVLESYSLNVDRLQVHGAQSQLLAIGNMLYVIKVDALVYLGEELAGCGINGYDIG